TRRSFTRQGFRGSCCRYGAISSWPPRSRRRGPSARPGSSTRRKPSSAVTTFTRGLLPEQFDYVLYFDGRRAVEPLERSVAWEAGNGRRTLKRESASSFVDAHVTQP